MSNNGEIHSFNLKLGIMLAEVSLIFVATALAQLATIAIV